MSETNDNFDGLKQLLKLKRHEVPPPGYFNHFSGDVVSRIRTGEQGGAEGVMGRFESNSLMKGLLQIFQAKPGVIGGFATSLCLLLLIGVVMAERPDGTSTTSDMATIQTGPGDSPSLAASASPLMPAGNSGITVSTNLVSLQPSVAVFGSQPNPLFLPASFTQSSQ